MANNVIGPGAERDEILRKLRGGLKRIESLADTRRSIEAALNPSKRKLVKTDGGVFEVDTAPKQPRGMNKWEAAYALVLKARQQAGEIDGFEFEGLSFKLGNGAYFTPDFVVVLWHEKFGGCMIELHEVKGHWREAARVRIKVAASKYPWCRFVAVSKDGAGWKAETFEP